MHLQVRSRSQTIRPERVADLAFDDVERVTRIELALSAWEAVPPAPITPVTCGKWWPPVRLASHQ
jgi:hypothetical protein